MRLAYAGAHHAAVEGLRKLIDELHAERGRLVQAWRDAGQTDEAWRPVDEIDETIDKQEKILMSMAP